jgi:hypothetical protein
MIARLTASLSLILLTCCTQPVTTALTGPTITFFEAPSFARVTSLAYNADSTTPVSFLAIANDPGGVRSLTVSFDTTVPGCTLQVSGVPIPPAANPPPPNAFFYAPVPPTQTASGPSSGQVPQLLLTASTLQGPYTCFSKVSIDVTRPYGQTINATAFAQNYSPLAPGGSAVLPIKFEPCPHLTARPVCG